MESKAFLQLGRHVAFLFFQFADLKVRIFRESSFWSDECFVFVRLALWASQYSPSLEILALLKAFLANFLRFSRSRE